MSPGSDGGGDRRQFMCLVISPPRARHGIARSAWSAVRHAPPEKSERGTSTAGHLDGLRLLAWRAAPRATWRTPSPAPPLSPLASRSGCQAWGTSRARNRGHGNEPNSSLPSLRGPAPTPSWSINAWPQTQRRTMLRGVTPPSAIGAGLAHRRHSQCFSFSILRNSRSPGRSFVPHSSQRRAGWRMWKVVTASPPRERRRWRRGADREP